MNKIEMKAPNLGVRELWSMTPEQFNQWRREHDYPRIVEYLKRELADFTDWMVNQEVTDSELIEFAPAIFLKRSNCIYVCDFECKDSEMLREVRYSKHSVGEIVFHEKRVLKIKKIIPFYDWLENSGKEKLEHRIFINTRRGRKAYIGGCLELIDMGGMILPEHFIMGGRELEFLNLDDLTLNNCHSNSYLKLWYSSAINLTVNGNLAFFDAYKTSFTEVGDSRTRSMKLLNGNFQSWKLVDCDVKLKITNSTMHLWEVDGHQFECVLEHSDIKDSKFSEGRDTFSKSASEFHRKIKILYAQIGNLNAAGAHYYKEKMFERKARLYPNQFYRTYPEPKLNTLKKLKRNISCFTKSLGMYINELFWGYGEKPYTIIGFSLSIILWCAVAYEFHPKSATRYDLLSSLEFSIASFTNVGSTAITQAEPFLRVLAFSQGLMGLLCVGLFVAGIASKNKQYS
ncbi:ion channel [Vibrio cyclitrophicus]|uniref:ion channel n=1 Tax=Vibrio cyclitrophicus TaxID=47951 RepID=UPI000C815A85|nr:ion channel [Vibrio cyclitrophicus]PME40969.1 hypothetical protein BCV36_19390 [Vibrio cyclitrophicus]